MRREEQAYFTRNCNEKGTRPDQRPVPHWKGQVEGKLTGNGPKGSKDQARFNAGRAFSWKKIETRRACFSC